MKSSPSVAWLVGASSGIGQALAFQLAQAGWQVAISARRLDALQAMQAQHPALHPYTVDVTDVPSLHEAAAAITRELGEIELCVLNAGDYTPMPLADFNIELFRKLCDINYLGAVNGLDAIMQRHGLHTIEGEPPDMSTVPPDSCAFAGRCKYATEECRASRPVLETLDGEHRCACFHMEQTRAEREALV